MAEMNSEYINSFLVAAKSVLQNCGIEIENGVPYVKNNAFHDDSVVICLGVTGHIRGQVLLAFNKRVACDIASKMCMMEIKELDEISLSALSELGNMIFGNAATVLSTKGIIVDITPPSVLHGEFTMESVDTKNICMPFKYDGDKIIELDIVLKDGKKDA